MNNMVIFIFFEFFNKYTRTDAINKYKTIKTNKINNQ